MERDIKTPVIWFAGRMTNKLLQNMHKGPWDECSYAYLLTRLEQELDELRQAVRSGSGGEIINEAADVANFAMMIADVTRQAIRK